MPAADCLHEENVIENCSYESSDTGAWYSCGQSGAWTNRGNVLRNNQFKNIKCHISGRTVQGCGGGVNAVYLDDQMSGWLVSNNTFENCDVAFVLGGGRSNVFLNNHIRDSKKAVHFDNRGMGWEHSQCQAGGKSQQEVLDVIHGPSGNKWASRFPELLNISAGGHLCVPVYNKIINNTYAKTVQFLDASESQVASWLSLVSGNVAEPSEDAVNIFV